jgi:RNA polymerase sigma factor (sigma-70 family)
MGPASTYQRIEACLDRLHNGDATARDDLIAVSCDRLRSLAKRMLRDFPKVGRWEDADDVAQEAALRLCRALREVKPRSAADFIGLAAVQIRRELLDLARRITGPEGIAHNHASGAQVGASSGSTPLGQMAGNSTYEPRQLAQWTEFHDRVDQLPDEERSVFELLWYQEVSQAQAAEILGFTLIKVKRRWQSARRRLYDLLRGEIPFEP